MADSSPDELSRRLAELSPAKRALLELKLGGQRAAATAGGSDWAAIPRRAADAPVPLSFAQQRLWFIDQLEPGSPMYNMPRQIRMQGRLNIEALKGALDSLVARHESLRTTCPVVEGQPRQVIAPAAPVVLALVELGALPPQEREAEARRLAVEEARRPFDLGRGPLFRSRLLRLDPEDHLLLLTLHHIISDGWSMGILFRELGLIYEALANGKPSVLPDLPIQYGDYALWQRERLQGAMLSRELAYWKQQIPSYPLPLELPTDRPRPLVHSPRGARLSFALPAPLSARIAALSRKEAVTPFMTLLAAFKVLLARYTGRDDIVVGTPIAGRTRPETERVIGFFVNTLALRTDLSGDPSFRELLARVREVALGAFGHQELPFERLVEELQPERDLSHAPLVQVLFSLQNFPKSERRLEGLTLRQMELSKGTAKFELTLGFTEKEGGFRGKLSYRTDLYDAETIERLARHLLVLLEGIVADPDRRLSALPLLEAAERRRLLVEWNATAVAYPCAQRGVSELITEQAARTPGAVAVVGEAGGLTYRELEERANEVAATLLARGVEPGHYVPLLMERSLELVIAMLAVMKAGAAFVPLDPEWPLARIRQALDELNGGLVLANPATPFGADTLGRARLVVDARAPATAVPPPTRPIDPAAPIYAIYTSGSTGRPKAAVVPHRGITNRFLWMTEYFGTEPARVVLQTTRPVYDSAIWQLFWPLTTGGRTVLPAPGLEADAGYLTDLIARHSVTMTDFVPSVFNALVPQLVADPAVRNQLLSLRSVIVGGEEITPSTTYRFQEHFPGVRVVNLYGPTECAIGCVAHEVTGREGSRIPIGRPIANVQVLVLDARGQPVPLGVPGELYLTGACLGLGYLGDPAQTKAAFVANSVPELAAPILYRTGDRVRYRTDGELEFLGRVDRQLKLRGYRIEPGEIEAVLLQHPEVGEAVVTVREDTPGERRLVGYVVAPPRAPAPDLHAVRAFLQQRLPEYMVPAALVPLEVVPRTAGGKLDRAALPAPEPGGAGLATAFVAPRTPTEGRLAELWTEVLRVPRVGVHDNFFELGGHSLLATLVITRIRAAWPVELPLRALFEAPTVAGLAQRLDAAERGALNRTSEAARLLAEVEGLSHDEVQRLLQETSATTPEPRLEG